MNDALFILFDVYNKKIMQDKDNVTVIEDRSSSRLFRLLVGPEEVFLRNIEIQLDGQYQPIRHGNEKMICIVHIRGNYIACALPMFPNDLIKPYH